jgi:hypothetical protein
MTTNETKSIAEWLKLEIFEEERYIYKVERYDTHERFAKTKKLIKLDFLHDRNQQKWIIDKLKELGYTIETNENKISSYVAIFNTYVSIYEHYTGHKEYGGEALIQAVEQLIDKENKEEK